MFCRKTLEYNTFCRETLKYDTFCRKNLDSALWAKKMANLRCEPTPHFMPLWITSYLNYAEGRKKPSQIHQMSHSRDKCIGGVWARLTDDLPTGSCAHHNIIHPDSQSFPPRKEGKGPKLTQRNNIMCSFYFCEGMLPENYCIEFCVWPSKPVFGRFYTNLQWDLNCVFLDLQLYWLIDWLIVCLFEG